MVKFIFVKQMDEDASPIVLNVDFIVAVYPSKIGSGTCFMMNDGSDESWVISAKAEFADVRAALPQEVLA